MKLYKKTKIILLFSLVTTAAIAQSYTNFQINMITELNNACRREGGGPNFCACYASTTTNTLKPADYLAAKAMEKNGLSIDRTQAYAMMDAAAYICSSLADPKK